MINKKIYLWLIFSLTIFALTINIVFDFTIVNQYHYIKDGENYTILHWLSFFTHWSNILVFIWSSYELINIYILKKESANAYFKQLTFSTIILVGIIAFPTIYMIAIINDFEVLFQIKDLKEWNSSDLHFSQELYVFIDAVITTIFHVVVPLLCLFYFIKNGRLSKELNKDETNRNILFNMIYIVIYFIWVFILTFFFNVENPYPFENFGHYNKIYIDFISIFINVYIGILFIVINKVLIKFNNSFYKNLK